MKTIDFDKLENLVIQPGMEKQLIPLALYRGGVSLGDIHRRWNFVLAMMLAEAESYKEARALWSDDKIAKLCFWNVKDPPSPMHMGSLFGRLVDNLKVTNNIPGLSDYAELIFESSNKYQIHLNRIAVRTNDYRSVVNSPWRKFVEKPSNPKKWKLRKLRGNPYDLTYPFLIHKPDAAGKNQGYDLLKKINDAVPSHIYGDLRADVCQDLAVAILSGDMKESELEDNSSRYIKRVMKMYPTKYGPISLDANIPWLDGATGHDRISSGEVMI